MASSVFTLIKHLF